jgi:RHS repeat-associated protein
MGCQGGTADLYQYVGTSFTNATETNPSERGAIGSQGRRIDPVTGNVIFGKREESLTQHDFTTQDPTGFGGGDSNLYRFVGNGPPNGTDPSGKDELKVVGANAYWVIAGDNTNSVRIGTVVPGKTDSTGGPVVAVKFRQTEGTIGQAQLAKLVAKCTYNTGDAATSERQLSLIDDWLWYNQTSFGKPATPPTPNPQPVPTSPQPLGPAWQGLTSSSLVPTGQPTQPTPPPPKPTSQNPGAVAANSPPRDLLDRIAAGEVSASAYYQELLAQFGKTTATGSRLGLSLWYGTMSTGFGLSDLIYSILDNDPENGETYVFLLGALGQPGANATEGALTLQKALEEYKALQATKNGGAAKGPLSPAEYARAKPTGTSGKVAPPPTAPQGTTYQQWLTNHGLEHSQDLEKLFQTAVNRQLTPESEKLLHQLISKKSTRVRGQAWADLQAVELENLPAGRALTENDLPLLKRYLSLKKGEHGGRWGNIEVRRLNHSLASELEDEGYKITGAGRSSEEHWGVGTAEETYVDIKATKAGQKTIRIQTVDTDAGGRLTSKEAAAAERIKAKFPNDELRLYSKQTGKRITYP